MSTWTTTELDSETKTYRVLRKTQESAYSAVIEEILADGFKSEDYAKILAEGFKVNRDCSNLTELKAKIKTLSPEELARRCCMETFSGTGLHNAPKFFSPHIISWWLGFQLTRRNTFFDFDSCKYEDVVQEIREMGKKVYSMYAV